MVPDLPDTSRRQFLAGVGLAGAGAGTGLVYQFAPGWLPGPLAKRRLLGLPAPTPVSREVAPSADHVTAAADHGARLRRDAAALWEGIDPSAVGDDFDVSWYRTRAEEASEYVQRAREEPPSVDAVLFARMAVERAAPALGAARVVTDTVDPERVRSRDEANVERARTVQEAVGYRLDGEPSLALGRLAWAEKTLRWGTPPDDGYLDGTPDPESWDTRDGGDLFGKLERDARRIDDAARLVAHHRSTLEAPRDVRDGLRTARDRLRRTARETLPDEAEFERVRGDRSTRRDWANVGATGMVFNDRVGDPYSGAPDDEWLAYGVLADARAALRGRGYRFARRRIAERSFSDGVPYDWLLAAKREGLDRLRAILDDTEGQAFHRLLALQATNALLVGDFPLEDWTDSGRTADGFYSAKADAYGAYCYGLGQLRALPAVADVAVPD